MLSMENSQNLTKNKFIIKLASYLTLVEKYLEPVLGSKQRYQFDPITTFISNFFANFNSITSIHINGIHFKILFKYINEIHFKYFNHINQACIWKLSLQYSSIQMKINSSHRCSRV